jgi:hypothetical protein
VTLELPFARDLWLANSASDWKTLYLAKMGGTRDQPPSCRHCLYDTNSIFRAPHLVDVQMALSVTLCSVWGIIWQYRKMKEASGPYDRGMSRSNSLAVNSLHQEAISLMQRLILDATERGADIGAPASLFRHVCLMHLHVSLEEVQQLAGREGEEEARRVLPLLRDWAESTEARQAIFHAGQVIRAAKQYTHGALRDFSAVAVYQASLAFWAYAVPYKPVTADSVTRPDGPLQNGAPLRAPGLDSVRLDADDGPELQRFLILGKGRPCIHKWPEAEGSGADVEVSLSDPVAVMTAITELLRKKNSPSESGCPPLVLNLSKLMKSLGTVAAAVQKK